MNGKKWFVLIPVLIGIALSIFAIWFYGFEKVEFGDAEDYINAANTFLNGTPYPRVSVVHPMFRPPLFPVFISIIWLVFPNSVIAVKIAQAFLHGATVFVIYKIAFEVLRKEIPAFFGALVCAVNPLLVAHTVDFYTEPLHTFLCALAMFWLVKFLKGDVRLFLYALSAGVTFGLATLCRPAILGVAICLVFVTFILQLKEIKRIKFGIGTAIILTGIFLTIAPWTLQNYRETSEFILVNDGFGYNLWLGNIPETIQLYEGSFTSKEENKKFADYVWGDIQRGKLAELEKSDNYSALKLNERERVWRREAVNEMTQDYGLTARLMRGKLLAFWTPFLNPLTYGGKTVALVALFVIGIYVFGSYGAYVFSRKETGKKFIILLAASFLITTAIHVLIFGFVRYRVPNVDPYLSMLTGVALWQIAVRFFPKYNFLQS
ncbi:MAG: glycosyltransferase family 39 protein [Acidobacteriota bacterium]|nr:glycosyltransferase family 39 protein [Acidobacteriota bacterium]